MMFYLFFYFSAKLTEAEPSGPTLTTEDDGLCSSRSVSGGEEFPLLRLLLTPEDVLLLLLLLLCKRTFEPPAPERHTKKTLLLVLEAVAAVALGLLFVERFSAETAPRRLALLPAERTEGRKKELIQRFEERSVWEIGAI